MGKLKVGVIGCGRIGALYDLCDPLRKKPASHIAAFQANSNCEVIAASDVNEDRLDNVCLQYGIEANFHEYQKMLDQLDFDIVSIATPVEEHWKQVINCAEHHIPLVFCEKPLSYDLKKAYTMVSTCKDYGTSLAVNYTRRWHPLYKFVKSKLSKDKVLHIIGITNGERGGAPQTHMFDLFNMYRNSDTKLEYIQLPHENYLIFELHIYTDRQRFSILDNGDAVLAGAKTKSIRYSDDTGTPITEISTSIIPNLTAADDKSPMQYVVENLVNHLKTGEPLECTGEMGLEALELAHKWRN